jgi:uncharacterized membrane protein
MPFCINCGASVEGQFCARCGTRAGTPPSAQGSSSGYRPAEPSGSPAQGLIPEEAAAALCYLLGVITGVLFLTVEPYNRNRNVRFHAWQSIFLFGGLTVVYIAGMFAAYVMPAVFAVLFWLGTAFGSLASFGLWLYLMRKTYNRQEVVLPVIGELARQQAG